MGGAQKFVKEQVVILTQNNYETYLITNRCGWLTESVSDINCNVTIHSGIESPFSVKFLRFLLEFLVKNNIDLIICSSANAGLYGRIAAYFTISKSIYVSHGWSSIYNGGKVTFILNFVEKLLSITGDSVLCVSQNDYDLAIKKIGINKKKLFLLPNSILPSIKKSDAYKGKVLRLVMVCRLDHPKRPELLIKAVQEIGKIIQLTIIGDGKQYSDLKALLREEDDNIILKGEILGFNDFDQYDAFALISLSEGLPMSAIEAMSSGLGLLLSDVGGCPSLIDNNGILVKNDINSIVNGLLKLRENLEFFKKNSLIKYNNQFNLKENSLKYISYYSSIILKENSISK